MANGSRQEPETVIAYIERAMDEDYRSNGVPAKLDKKTSNEEMFNVLSEDMEIRYPVTLRRLKLFQVKREKDENILSFINRVREDARYADIDGLSADYLHDSHWPVQSPETFRKMGQGERFVIG